MGKTIVTFDYSKCHSGANIDPRECRQCLYVCDPAVLLMHPTLNDDHPDPHNPEIWRIDAIWLSKCTGCMKCVEICPEQAITVVPGKTLYEIRTGH
ncbi:MAG: 4Fe-4S binding protein [Candidatus Thorarchaeota archaeon]|jgi:formate hydrogenlyase subunit 6/NADH:ubiquinone oxidoreductase subunit I